MSGKAVGAQEPGPNVNPSMTSVPLDLSGVSAAGVPPVVNSSYSNQTVESMLGVSDDVGGAHAPNNSGLDYNHG